MTVRMGLGGAVALGAAACTYSPFYYGSFPFDGQSMVSVDAVLEINGPMPEQWGDLRAGIELFEVDSGRSVPFEYVINAQRNRVKIYPLERLNERTEYHLSGVSSWKVGGVHGTSMHCFGWCDEGLDPIRATFYTGPRPEHLRTFLVDGALVLAFSEQVAEVEPNWWAESNSHYLDEPNVADSYRVGGHASNFVFVQFAGDGAYEDHVAFEGRVRFASGGTLDVSYDGYVDPLGEDGFLRFDAQPHGEW